MNELPATSPARGACLCGAVSFVLRWPSKWVAHCHCTMCQRAHGAAFVTWVSVPSELFELRDSQRLLREYQSSPEAWRSFCGRCGSSLIFRSQRWPGEVHVARSNISDPVDRAPMAHAFFDTHVDWFDVSDALPKRTAPK
jgi:hypothetical protein